MITQINFIKNNSNSFIKKRSDLFDRLRTGWENPDYSCIEVYWEVLRPMSDGGTKKITITDTGISSALAPHDKNKKYYSQQTIKNKLRKLVKYGVIEIHNTFRLSGAEYITPMYEFELSVL
jgi:hypothetical protein